MSYPALNLVLWVSQKFIGNADSALKNTSLQFLKLRINVNQKPFVFSAGLWNAAGQQKCAGLSRVPRDFVVPHSRDFQSRSRNLAGLSRENESRSRVG